MVANQENGECLGMRRLNELELRIDGRAARSGNGHGDVRSHAQRPCVDRDLDAIDLHDRAIARDRRQQHVGDDQRQHDPFQDAQRSRRLVKGTETIRASRCGGSCEHARRR